MAHRLRFGGCIAVVAAVIAGSAAAEQVVRVKDGDSLVIASGGKQVDVRLADIDAPEHRQPHGDAARSALRALVGERDVRLQLVGGDAYRRIVAHVYVDGIDVNQEMVRRGHAWVRRAYDPAPTLIAAEDAARAEQLGLWRKPAPIPPWEWRRGKRSAGKQLAAAAGGSARTAADGPQNVAALSIAPATIPTVQCGSKRYCREMASCAEALAFLRQCAVGTLDGDGDGTPCEALCRAAPGETEARQAAR